MATIHPINDADVKNKRRAKAVLKSLWSILIALLLFTAYWILCSMVDNSPTKEWVPFLHVVNPYNHPYLFVFTITIGILISLIYGIVKLMEYADK